MEGLCREHRESVLCFSTMTEEEDFRWSDGRGFAPPSARSLTGIVRRLLPNTTTSSQAAQTSLD
jgi:hypothetical protein